MTDRVSSFIIQAMDRAAARQRLYAHDLANVATPGQRPAGPSFRESLRALAPGEASGSRLLEDGNPAPPPIGAAGRMEPGQDPAGPALSPEAWSALLGGESSGPEAAVGGGLEARLSRLSANTMYFNVLARVLGTRLRTLETAIQGR